ncbi:hypothetical protein [Gloeobacter kilaueensis]|uniref:Uncharacterized protein n=1 Tax=Gloeobacter kilaueensis (strain ATCC BAA-2537 / CCAP 1431/1 / ULC 316 / JS1) TaxID=1183438 RepID=U5QCN6_GLOK1|nr:hypothetical protein [Gloeobacter kilaueensis]AGY56608.1 hypothetical protein GKIL_0361 [Gloeobacter kilaueensis JS1]
MVESSGLPCAVIASRSPQLPPARPYYTGAGATHAPPDICALVVLTAQHLASTGMILRTGVDKGADAAFAAGAGERREIYAPHTGAGGYKDGIVIGDAEVIQQAVAVAVGLHPDWRSYNDFSRRAHLRRVFQMLGKDLRTPSAFLICWAPTEDGVVEGSVRTAVALAHERAIPAYNLHELTTRTRFRERLEELQQVHW